MKKFGDRKFVLYLNNGQDEPEDLKKFNKNY